MQTFAKVASYFLFACTRIVSQVNDSVVEMPGIEPGSLGEDLVILRAQFGLAFLCPDVHPNEMSTGTATV